MLLIYVKVAVIAVAIGAVYAVAIAPAGRRLFVACLFAGLAGAGYAIGWYAHHAEIETRGYFAMAGGLVGALLGFCWVSLRRRRWAGEPVDESGGVFGGILRPRHQRKLSNYLLDKKLQLRYVFLVTILSAVIAGVLGYMIYDQQRTSWESIEHDLNVLTQPDDSPGLHAQVASLASDERILIYEMVAVGIGLVIILSAYLVIMTHKVAGPLFKVSMYFEHMAQGRLGVVTPLRRGDMLQDFFGDFKSMHESLRARSQADVAVMDRALAALRDAQVDAAARGALDGALDALDRHVASRKQQLA